MKAKAPSLFDAFDVDTPHVTEVRRLLQNLARQGKEGERSVYMVTSAGRSEGKSVICGLMAIVAAKIFRRRTLLIDGDMRRPTAHLLMGCAQRPGLYELLAGKVSVDLATRPTPIPTLSVIPSGRPIGPVANAYDDDAFAALLKSLRPKFEMIIVDSAPAVPVVEPLLMAEHVDGILLVAMAGKTPVTLIRRLRQVMSPLADRVAGVILNNAAEGLPYYYDYRYYGYQQPRTRKMREAPVRLEGAAGTDAEPTSAPAPKRSGQGGT